MNEPAGKSGLAGRHVVLAAIGNLWDSSKISFDHICFALECAFFKNVTVIQMSAVRFMSVISSVL